MQQSRPRRLRLPIAAEHRKSMKTSLSSSSSKSEVLNRSIEYGMASVDLASKWLELVENGQVAASIQIPASDEDDEKDSQQLLGVSYGVRLHPHSTPDQTSFREFVEGTDSEAAKHPKIASMNATLAQAATASTDAPESVQFRYHGGYFAQLQLVRTLRPPPSPGVGSNNNKPTSISSSTPPPYNPETDSFVTGPLRLELRPLVTKLKLPNLSTPWDVFHNVSPADVRGHFLLVPSLKNSNKNWRQQALTANDCQDLVYLAASIDPIGSLIVCFNSVGAGASQNHIHCHLWPSPPVPLLEPLQPYQKNNEENQSNEDHGHSHSHEHMNNDDDNDEKVRGWSCYPASRVKSIYDYADITDSEGQPLVEASYLDYPCFCIQLSSVSYVNDNDRSLDILGQAVWEVLSCIGDAPHNVCMINRPSAGDGEDGFSSHDVDVYMFIRSRERSPSVVPTSKLGASEMMGVFHCQSVEQLDELTQGGNNESPMAQALQEISHDQTDTLWETIKSKLSKIVC